MSVNAIEKAIWQVTTNAADRERFRTDLLGYLSGFAITEEERAIFVAWNIQELLRRGVNPGLMLSAYSAIHGRGRRTEYLADMRKNADN